MSTTTDAQIQTLLALVTQQAQAMADMTAGQHKLLERFAAQEATQVAPIPGAVPAERRILVVDLVAKARLMTKSSSLRTYQHAWNVLAHGIGDHTGLGERFADTILPSDLQQLLALIGAQARDRNQARDTLRFEVGRATLKHDGIGAQYNAVGAWRRLFKIALDDGHVLGNPASSLKKPRRRSGTRDSFSPERIKEVLEVVGATGDDPELDLLITETLLITGARREALVGLRLMHLDAVACEVTLDDKNDSLLAQPVPDWLVRKLRRFAHSRGARTANDAVFRKRQRDGSFVPISSRRLDNLFTRVQTALPWADGLKVTAHTLRHCGGTYVERVAGEAVAHRWLRHSDEDVTKLYVRASQAEVAAAVVAIWGGSHPLVADSKEMNLTT